MKQLSDLLREAKADAPPLRLDVEDVVAAGRTRRRRRNTGWVLAAVYERPLASTESTSGSANS